MRTTSIVALFALATGALCAPVQANDAALAVEARAPAPEVVPVQADAAETDEVLDARATDPEIVPVQADAAETDEVLDARATDPEIVPVQADAAETDEVLDARATDPYTTPQPAGKQLCTIGMNGVAGFIDAKDVRKQASALCAKLGGNYAGESKITGAIVCHNVPVAKGLSGKVPVTLKAGGTKDTIYQCLSK